MRAPRGAVKRPAHAPRAGRHHVFAVALAVRRQRSEQKRTCSQSRSHFLRQVKGRPQAAQVLVGRSAFLTPRGMGSAAQAAGEAGDVEGGKAVVAQPAEVGLEERAQVGDAVFQHGDAVDAHAEGEALPLIGVDAAGT